MGKKKKIRKKRSSEKTVLSEKEEEILAAILKNTENLTPDNIKERITSNEMAIGLVERLPVNDPSIMDLLLMIEDNFEDKNIRKAVKKVFFKLKQKGVSIPDRETSPDSPFTLPKQESDDSETFVSSIDPEGTRSILLMIPHALKGVEIGVGVVNCYRGIEYFIYNNCGRRRSKEIKRYFFEQNSQVVETSISHAATILERGYKKDELKAGKTAGDYLKIRPWILENSTLLEEPIIYGFMNKQDISIANITDSRIEKLFEHELMESWIIDAEEIKPVLDDILKVDDSLIIISEDQKMDRINEIEKKALSDLYPETRRLILKDMLEETAYIFYRLGEEEYAKICVAAAQDVGETSTNRDLFLRYLLERSLDLYMSLEENSESDVIDTNSEPTIIAP